MKRPTSLTAAGAAVAIALTGAVGMTPAYAVSTGGGGIALTTTRTTDNDAVELQRVRAAVRSKGVVLKRSAPLLVTAEVPGEVADVDKRKRLGLPTWRVVVEMETGYRVAAFVHRKTGVIIDWVVLEVPADVEYTPPAQDTKKPKPNPAKPKPAPVPEVLQEAVDVARGLAAPASPGLAGTPATPASPASGSKNDDDDGDDADHSDDRGDDHRDGSDRSPETSSDSDDNSESRDDREDRRDDGHRDGDGDRDRHDEDRGDQERDDDD